MINIEFWEKWMLKWADWLDVISFKAAQYRDRRHR